MTDTTKTFPQVKRYSVMSLVRQVDDRPCYDPYPCRSFAPQLAPWLRDAMSRGLPS